MNFKIVSIFFILLLNFASVCAQNNPQFDEKLEKQYREISDLAPQDPKKALLLAENFIEKSKELANTYYQLKGYELKDEIYGSQNENKKLLASTEQTIALADQLKEYRIEILAAGRKSFALTGLGLYPESKKNLEKTELLVKNLGNSDKDLQIKISFWGIYADYYNEQNKTEHAIEMLKKALNECQKIANKDKKIPHLMQSYSDIATCFLSLKKSDSAIYYYKNAQNILSSAKQFEKRQEGAINLGFGTAFNQKTDYKTAIPYLTKALEIGKKGNYEDVYLDALKQLSVSFDYTSKDENNPYYKQYILTKKEFEEKKNLSPKEIDTKKNKDKSFFDRHKTLIISLSSILLALFVMVTLFLSKKSKKIEEKHQEATEIVKEQSEEITELKTKVNDAFDEVLELAKSNDPSFLKRFSEVYDKVYNGLIEKYPELSDTQLKILALSYLNFSTKDIATSTNTSPRTVQTHKYNIRKMTEISPDEDFIKWIRHFESTISRG